MYRVSTIRAARGLAAAAFTAALVGAQFAAPAGASADATAPGAPVISVNTEPPAGTQSCPAPTGGATLAMGTVCSFTLSPNPADTSVPTEYQFTYPYGQGAPEYVSAADPGNGNTFDAATGVATVSVLVTEDYATLAADEVGAGNHFGPTAQQTVVARDPVNVGTSQTFGDYDGDGTSDLVAAPLKPGDALANGLWFAKGGAGGTVSTNAENLAADDDLSSLPVDYTGAEVVLGDWCGTGETSMLVYYPQGLASTEDVGGGYIFCGDGDHDVVRSVSNLDGAEFNISNGNLDDANGVAPTELVDAGDLTQTDTGLPNVLAVLDNELLLAPAAATGLYSSDGQAGSVFGAPGGLCSAGSCALLSDTPSPDGTFDWNAWKLVGYPQADGRVDMYLWNPATGELVLWTDVTANDAANDGTWTNYTTLTYTQYVIASGTGTSTWNQGGDLELQAADFNGDGVPDLWAIDPATATVVPYTAKINGSALTLACGAKKSLVTPAHEWELNDLASGSANKALDSGSDTAETLQSADAGATWTPDPTFGAAIRFDGSTGNLQTNSETPSSGDAVTTGSSFTIGAWVQPTAAGTVLSQEGTDDSSVFLSAAADGTWQFGINTAGTTAATYAQDEAGSWTAGEWAHVVLTYDASTGRLVLYVNGDRADTVHVSGAATADGPFVLGANQADGTLGSYFAGELARVVTFDRSLTAQEVKQLP